MSTCVSNGWTLLIFVVRPNSSTARVHLHRYICLHRIYMYIYSGFLWCVQVAPQLECLYIVTYVCTVYIYIGRVYALQQKETAQWSHTCNVLFLRMDSAAKSAAASYTWRHCTRDVAAQSRHVVSFYIDIDMNSHRLWTYQDQARAVRRRLTGHWSPSSSARPSGPSSFPPTPPRAPWLEAARMK
jgi:hypothetical protein